MTISGMLPRPFAMDCQPCTMTFRKGSVIGRQLCSESVFTWSGYLPASGKPVVVKFDGGLLSSDGGILALREVEQRLRLADRLAACILDPRDPDQVTHSLADIIRFRLLMISAGYEDGNDANCLRSDPMFKMALDLSPSDRELCSNRQSRGFRV